MTKTTYGQLELLTVVGLRWMFNHGGKEEGLMLQGKYMMKLSNTIPTKGMIHQVIPNKPIEL